MSTYSRVGRTHDKAWVVNQRQWLRAKRRAEFKRGLMVFLRPILLIGAALLTLGFAWMAQ